MFPIVQALGERRQVRDSFLDELHPSLRLAYRTDLEVSLAAAVEVVTAIQLDMSHFAALERWRSRYDAWVEWWAVARSQPAFADGVARSLGLKLDPKMDNGVTHSTGNHPSLEGRLRALGVAAAEVDSQPAHVAADLVPCLEAVERRLTECLGKLLCAAATQRSAR